MATDHIASAIKAPTKPSGNTESSPDKMYQSISWALFLCGVNNTNSYYARTNNMGLKFHTLGTNISFVTYAWKCVFVHFSSVHTDSGKVLNTYIDIENVVAYSHTSNGSRSRRAKTSTSIHMNTRICISYIDANQWEYFVCGRLSPALTVDSADSHFHISLTIFHK